MRLRVIEVAISEAERFLERAKSAKREAEKDQFKHSHGRKAAACKRSSMDLTMALASLRKYNS